MYKNDKDGEYSLVNTYIISANVWTVVSMCILRCKESSVRIQERSKSYRETLPFVYNFYYVVIS